MKTGIVALGLATVAYAGVAQRKGHTSSGCCFSLYANGGASGYLGQSANGNKLHGHGNPGKYCLKNGAVHDAHGRACALSGNNGQWHCSRNQPAQSDFYVTSDNLLSCSSGSTFHACPDTSNYGEWNIHQSDNGLKGCVPVSLSTSGQCQQSTSAATATPDNGGGDQSVSSAVDQSSASAAAPSSMQEASTPIVAPSGTCQSVQTI